MLNILRVFSTELISLLFTNVLVIFFTYSKEFSYTVHNFYERIRNNRNEELLELISNEDINFYLNNYSNKIILF